MHKATQSPENWHKSSHSSTSKECVEVAEGGPTAVRDTRNREAGHLEFAPGEWQALIRAL